MYFWCIYGEALPILLKVPCINQIYQFSIHTLFATLRLRTQTWLQLYDSPALPVEEFFARRVLGSISCVITWRFDGEVYQFLFASNFFNDSIRSFLQKLLCTMWLKLQHIYTNINYLITLEMSSKCEKLTFSLFQISYMQTDLSNAIYLACLGYSVFLFHLRV